MHTPTVLLIDDDAFARMTARTMLENLACDVTEAEDGAVATTKMETLDFDLVVTDIFMPNQDGIETIRKIRRAHNNVCIVAISGDDTYSDINYLSMAKRIGADYTLTKPLHLEELAGIVSALKVTA